MDFSNMPTWSGYVAAPLLILVFGHEVILNSDNPGILIAILIAIGLVCGAVLHAFVYLNGDNGKDEQ